MALYRFRVVSKYVETGYVIADSKEKALEVMLSEDAGDDTWDSTGLEFLEYDEDTFTFEESI